MWNFVFQIFIHYQMVSFIKIFFFFILLFFIGYSSRAIDKNIFI